ncbi:MAG: ATP phosphoribosyltransferase [Methylacidiphilales bacterium]|nr:ATP phosphoribosyltransferase [Candidatus Methylacidiphilales bacterium]
MKNKPITIAIAKGRTFNDNQRYLIQLGFTNNQFEISDRSLIFKHPNKLLTLVKVRSIDVTTLVHIGVADLGVVGKDILLENECSGIIELSDLGNSKCKMVYAKPKHSIFTNYSSLLIATKYPNITKNYFLAKKINVDTVILHGALEMAPSIGLADAIVDLSNTGDSLKAHNLVIEDELFLSSARLIANRAAYITKRNELEQIKNIFNLR